MALSAAHADVNNIVQDEKGVRLAIRVKNGSTIYHGALVQFDALTGLVHAYGGTEAERLAGWHFGDTVVGDDDGNPPPEAHLITGPFIWKNLTVGGLTGTASTDIGKSVYATDDGTYTVSDPGGTGARIGIVVRAVSSSKADVYFRNVMGHLDTEDPQPTPSPTPSPSPTPTPTP